MATKSWWKGWVWVWVAVTVVVAALVLRLSADSGPSDAGVSPPVARAPVPAPPTPTLQDTAGAGSARVPTASASDGGALAKLLPPLPTGEEPGEEQESKTVVELEVMRAKLPDNLYWEIGVPTTDPAEVRRRAESTRKWNELYGKVLAGEASEEEVTRYYDRRQKVSEDFIAFAEGVISEYGGRLSEQERGLYDLSINMHRTRLAELPAKREESLALQREKARQRSAWQQGGQQP